MRWNATSPATTAAISASPPIVAWDAPLTSPTRMSGSLPTRATGAGGRGPRQVATATARAALVASRAGQCLSQALNRIRNDVVGVGRRDEGRLEGGRREEHASLARGRVEAPEEPGIA